MPIFFCWAAHCITGVENPSLHSNETTDRIQQLPLKLTTSLTTCCLCYCSVFHANTYQMTSNKRHPLWYICNDFFSLARYSSAFKHFYRWKVLTTWHRAFCTIDYIKLTPVSAVTPHIVLVFKYGVCHLCKYFEQATHQK